jgi:hypothetical protein
MPAYMKLGDIKGEVVVSRMETTMVATELLAPGTTPQPAGLLLPAVQKVREAARRSGASQGPTNLKTTPQAPQLIGLLLPAVQKVREAASWSNRGMPGSISAGQTNTAIGLLLPAVQKVREAAKRSAGGAVAMHVHGTGSAGALRAIRQSKVVNATIDLPDGGNVHLEDAVVFDVDPAGKGLDVVIGFSRSS